MTLRGFFTNFLNIEYFINLYLCNYNEYYTLLKYLSRCLIVFFVSANISFILILVDKAIFIITNNFKSLQFKKIIVSKYL